MQLSPSNSSLNLYVFGNSQNTLVSRPRLCTHCSMIWLEVHIYRLVVLRNITSNVTSREGFTVIQNYRKRKKSTTATALTSRGFERSDVGGGLLSEGGRREEQQGEDQQTAPRHVVAAAVARAGARTRVRAMRHPLLLQRPACNTQRHVVREHLLHKRN